MSDKTRALLVQAGKGVVGTFDLPAGTKSESPPRPYVPPDVVPLHETPRPDGLAVDTAVGGYALRRVSLFRNRWPEVLAFDERVTPARGEAGGRERAARRVARAARSSGDGGR